MLAATVALTDPAPAAAPAVPAYWVVPPVLASGTRLPVPTGLIATWRADGRAVSGGVLTNRSAAERVARLEGTLTQADGTTATKRFTVRLLGKNVRRLQAYARTPTARMTRTSRRSRAACILP